MGGRLLTSPATRLRRAGPIPARLSPFLDLSGAHKLSTRGPWVTPGTLLTYTVGAVPGGVVNLGGPGDRKEDWPPLRDSSPPRHSKRPPQDTGRSSIHHERTAPSTRGD
jgi:hypothetical protein